MKLIDKLKSDLKIAEAELSVLNKIPGDIAFVLYETTKEKIQSINKQISELESNTKYIDRRETGYIH
jgi:hypothetical protein